MKSEYLLPNNFRKIGWIMFIPSFLLGIATMFFEYEPEFLNVKIPSFLSNEFFGDIEIFKMIENNILNEIVAITFIIALIFISFSKEKQEDEYISEIRLQSLVWSVYINYAILIISMILLYDLSFFYVMIGNMFTVLIIFLLKFKLELNKVKKSLSYEE